MHVGQKYGETLASEVLQFLHSDGVSKSSSSGDHLDISWRRPSTAGRDQTSFVGDVSNPSGVMGNPVTAALKQQEAKSAHRESAADGGNISGKLAGIRKSLEQAGTSEEAMMLTAFGNKVIRSGLPVFDVREHDEVERLEQAQMGNRYPGGDVMHQMMFQKWKQFGALGFQIPPEEDWYLGARLGEYARPLIMGPRRVGYLNQAPVPMSQSEDLFTLISEAGVGSRRARNAAIYAKQSSGQAMEFFRLAQRRAKQIFHDPPVSVLPGADVYPMYSATCPFLQVPPPPISYGPNRRCHRRRRQPTKKLSGQCARCTRLQSASFL